MGKRVLCLYIEDELIQLSKARNINISQFLTNLLSIELSVKDFDETTPQDIIISKLKTSNSLLTDELKNVNEDREKLSKKILGLNRDIDIKEAEIKIRDDKVKLLNEKVKKMKEDDEDDGFVYPR
jgi:hypothetical protein